MEQLTADEMTKLVAAWQAGAISKKTLYYNLQWGEWARPDVTFEQEQQEIENEEPDEPIEGNPLDDDDDEDDDDDPSKARRPPRE
jgi:hypothetical protein